MNLPNWMSFFHIDPKTFSSKGGGESKADESIILGSRFRPSKSRLNITEYKLGMPVFIFENLIIIRLKHPSWIAHGHLYFHFHKGNFCTCFLCMQIVETTVCELLLDVKGDNWMASILSKFWLLVTARRNLCIFLDKIFQKWFAIACLLGLSGINEPKVIQLSLCLRQDWELTVL